MTWSATAVTAALRGLIVTLILLPLLLLLLHLLVSAGPQRTHGIRAALLARLLGTAELHQLLDIGDSLHVSCCKASFLHLPVPEASKGYIVDSLLHKRDTGVAVWRWTELRQLATCCCTSHPRSKGFS